MGLRTILDPDTLAKRRRALLDKARTYRNSREGGGHHIKTTATYLTWSIDSAVKLPMPSISFEATCVEEERQSEAYDLAQVTRYSLIAALTRTDIGPHADITCFERIPTTHFATRRPSCEEASRVWPLPDRTKFNPAG